MKPDPAGHDTQRKPDGHPVTQHVVRFGKRHKYGAVRTVVDGITFASKAEAARYSQLKLLERAGKIARLELQPKFPLSVQGTPCGSYIADFQYVELGPDGHALRTVVEDVKGVRTETYRLKRKLVKALYGIEITEIRK